MIRKPCLWSEENSKWNLFIQIRIVTKHFLITHRQFRMLLLWNWTNWNWNTESKCQKTLHYEVILLILTAEVDVQFNFISKMYFLCIFTRFLVNPGISNMLITTLKMNKKNKCLVRMYYHQTCFLSYSYQCYRWFIYYQNKMIHIIYIPQK